MKGVDLAIISELQCKTCKDEYLICNCKIYNGFTVIDVFLSKYWREVVEVAQKDGFMDVRDMLTLNNFIWQGLLQVFEECTLSTKIEILSPKGGLDDLFIHNDICDKLAEIGKCLVLFRAEVEKMNI